MYVAYIDESGDDGANGSRSYALGCVMIDAANWADTFDRMIGFRRRVRATYGIKMRAEIKANYLLRNGGPLRSVPLSELARFKLYRAHMRIQNKLGMDAFAVVVDKQEALTKFGGGRATSDIAWEYLLQRLERRSTKEGTEILVIHDEGDSLTVRKRVRKARRAGSAGSHFGTGTLDVPFTRLLDDPVPPRLDAVVLPAVGRPQRVRGVPTYVPAAPARASDRPPGHVGRAGLCPLPQGEVRGLRGPAGHRPRTVTKDRPAQGRAVREGRGSAVQGGSVFEIKGNSGVGRYVHVGSSPN